MDRYENLTEFKDLTFYAKGVALAHEALQELEAGAKFTPLKQASALFQFLSAIAYYPFTVTNADTEETIEVDSLSLVVMEDAENEFGVVFHGYKENGEKTSSPPCGILGPNSEFSDYWLTVDEVMELIEAKFPGVVVTNSTLVSVPPDFVPLHHVSVRPEFMQPKSVNFPLPSGSAVSSDLALALMQATVRMLGGLVSVDAANLATKTLLEKAKVKKKKPKKKTLSELYDGYETELEQRITEVLNKKFGIE